jgi:hypothetical protein
VDAELLLIEVQIVAADSAGDVATRDRLRAGHATFTHLTGVSQTTQAT